LDSLLSISEQNPGKFPPKEFAMCIARFAIRQIKTERSIWKCFEYLSSGSPEDCSAALFALWRSAPNGLIDLEISKHKEELISLTINRIQIFECIWRHCSGDRSRKIREEILDSLEKAETNLDDWHVWVQVIRARATLSSSNEEMLSKYLEYLSAKNDHIKITALQTMRVTPSLVAGTSLLIDSLRLRLCSIANTTTENEAVRGEALIALGKYFSKELESFHTWTADNRVSPRLKAKFLEGSAQQITKEHLSLLRHNLNHESNRVAMAAWDFIRPMLSPAVIKKLGLDSNESISLPRDIATEAKKALAKNDAGITTVVANLYADTMVFKNFKSMQG
jgi:hypothetical protein